MTEMLHFVFFFTYALLGLIITGAKCNTPLPSQRPSCAVDSHVKRSKLYDKVKTAWKRQ